VCGGVGLVAHRGVTAESFSLRRSSLLLWGTELSAQLGTVLSLFCWQLEALLIVSFKPWTAGCGGAWWGLVCCTCKVFY
jgi:hypothetical protein